jgi:hypothetical protein
MMDTVIIEVTTWSATDTQALLRVLDHSALVASVELISATAQPEAPTAQPMCG